MDCYFIDGNPVDNMTQMHTEVTMPSWEEVGLWCHPWEPSRTGDTLSALALAKGTGRLGATASEPGQTVNSGFHLVNL